LKIRETVKRFKPYEWEPNNEAISAEVGIPPEEIIRFDTNTSPFTPSKLLSELGRKLSSLKVNDYPDTSYTSLREALSKYTGASIEQISVTNGADEALDIIAKTFVDSGTTVLVSVPTYSMYRITTEIMGGKVMPVLRRGDLSDDVDAIINVAEGVRAVFLCSPNNPTGNLTKRSTVLRLLREVDAPIIVDEAYFEFCGKTVADLVAKYENLIVVRTLSKAFGLASVRVGYMIAASETVNILNRVRPPNSLGIMSITLAQAALREVGYMERNRELIVRERERLREALKELGKIYVYPSEANFFLVRFKYLSGSEVYRRLLRLGIVTRDVSDLPMLENCLRLTVRTPEENDKLLEALAKITS
jgi:histidinol-phosphate aminotransferase